MHSFLKCKTEGRKILAHKFFFIRKTNPIEQARKYQVQQFLSKKKNHFDLFQLKECIEPQNVYFDWFTICPKITLALNQVIIQYVQCTIVCLEKVDTDHHLGVSVTLKYVNTYLLSAAKKVYTKQYCIIFREKYFSIILVQLFGYNLS